MRASAAKRIRETYQRLAPRGDAVVADFYDRLFQRAPGVRVLFPPNLSAMRGHFWAALAIVARNADNLEALREPLRGLGRAHVGFGAEPEHYDVVREVLLDSLASFLADDWTRKVRDAWDEAISTVSAMMLGAGAPGPVPEAR